MRVVTKTDIGCFPLLSRGKVRDIYELDERSLLIVTTDRMSAFDVILDEPVPGKGIILNQLTLFWMRKFESIIPNHILESEVDNFPAKLRPWRDVLVGRSVIARKAKPLPVECIVRGYISGSGWKDYQATGKVCGHELPPNLVESQKLPQPLFTPSTKAMQGEHDENINMAQAAALLGDDTAKQVEMISLALYEGGRAHAAECGIIVADTKFELGYIDGVLHLVDEVLTPDSSRFWPAAQYKQGQAEPSFDKQYLRDWLNSRNWNHQPPPPHVPGEIIEATARRYQEAYDMLAGKIRKGKDTQQ